MDLVNQNPAPTSNNTAKFRGRLVLTRWVDDSFSAELRVTVDGASKFVRLALTQATVNAVTGANPTAFGRSDRDHANVVGRLVTRVGTITLDTTVVGAPSVKSFVPETTPADALAAFDKAFAESEATKAASATDATAE
mgnify:FL=1